MANIPIPTRVALSRNPSQADLIPGANWIATETGDEYETVCTGREMVLFRNPTAAAVSCHVRHTPNAGFARTNSSTNLAQTTIVVPAFGGFGLIGPVYQDGFIQANGMLRTYTSSPGILIAIVELPVSWNN